MNKNDFSNKNQGQNDDLSKIREIAIIKDGKIFPITKENFSVAAGIAIAVDDYFELSRGEAVELEETKDKGLIY